MPGSNVMSNFLDYTSAIYEWLCQISFKTQYFCFLTTLNSFSRKTAPIAGVCHKNKPEYQRKLNSGEKPAKARPKCVFFGCFFNFLPQNGQKKIWDHFFLKEHKISEILTYCIYFQHQQQKNGEFVMGKIYSAQCSLLSSTVVGLI